VGPPRHDRGAVSRLGMDLVRVVGRLAAGTLLVREELDLIGAYGQRRSERGWRQPQLAAL
jgi:hypothetical protein